MDETLLLETLQEMTAQVIVMEANLQAEGRSDALTKAARDYLTASDRLVGMLERMPA